MLHVQPDDGVEPMSKQPSPLRQRMIDDNKIRNMSPELRFSGSYRVINAVALASGGNYECPDAAFDGAGSKSLRQSHSRLFRGLLQP